MSSRRLAMILGLLMTLFAAPSSAASNETTCPKKEWNEACFDNTAGTRRLKPAFIKRVKFQRNGFAVLYLEGHELVAINRKGVVVVPGIVSGDFSYEEAENGVAAFYTRPYQKGNNAQRKCGYFQLSNFKIVIPPVYDICARFQREKAYVCVNCHLDCADCHNYAYYGDKAYVITPKNEVLRTITLPKIPLCSTVEQLGGFPADQPCRAEDR